MLKLFFALRLEIEKFMNEKGDGAAELSDEEWFCDLALLWYQPPRQT